MPREKFGEKEFSDSLSEIYGGRYEVIEGSFSTMQEKVQILDNVCGNIFECVANEVTRSRVQERLSKACPSCRAGAKVTLSEASEKLARMSKGKLEITGEYRNTREKCSIRCCECGYEWEADLHYIFNNLSTNTTNAFGCPVCSGKKKRTTESFREALEDMPDGGEYELVGEYFATGTPVTLKHLVCGCVYQARPRDVLYKGNRCPKCSLSPIRESKAVFAVKETLLSYDISFETEVQVEGCKGRTRRHLPFDFCVDLPDGTFALIEFDGPQHFQSSERWGGEKKFRQTVEYDLVKTEFCSKHGIPFLRINYRDFGGPLLKKLRNFLLENGIST